MRPESTRPEAPPIAASAAHAAIRWDRAAFAHDARATARRLLGSLLVRIADDGQRLAGTIVETEAYLGPEDLASHARGGRRTTRNESMWRAPGTAYVYFTYGMHHCFNISCWRAEHPAAVLIRAIVPHEGIERLRRDRQRATRASRTIPDRRLTDGPAKLCQAMRIDRSLDGEDLGASSRLWIERRASPASSLVRVTPRIGIGSAGAWADAPLRFVLDGPRDRA